MLEVTADNALSYLRETGALAEDVRAEATPLAWGVSNIVLRITPLEGAGPEFVVKQSREQLRTQAEWRSRLDRIWREVDVLQIIQPLLPEGVVPRVLFEDRENYLFGMEAIERGHVVWKQALLDGEVNLALAEPLAGYLSRVHLATWESRPVRERVGDTQAFDELRLDPFYRYLLRRHPDLQEPVRRLVGCAADHPCCLVLGDFSPKNILLTSRGVSLVDFETGHFGDPAFDVGFFLSHLALKALRAGRESPLFDFCSRWWGAYSNPVRKQVGTEELEARCVLHWAGCMLARVDGKSTVDYLSREHQDGVRTFTRSILLAPPDSLPAALERFRL